MAPILFSSLILLSSISNNLAAKHGHSTTSIHHHHHRTTVPPYSKLHQAYIALQSWKKVIYSDPGNFTSNWIGPDVCNYNGIYCAPHTSNNSHRVVAGIDFNHANLAGFLPDEIGFLSDLALIHLNSNRFCGILPQTLSNLTLLYELDISNNRFVGDFPTVVLSLPSLRFLDLRYNEFEGPIPPQLFTKGFDAIFINNNNLTGTFSAAFSGKSPSVLVFANNNFGGCLPPSIANFADSLEELLFINTSISGCLPPEVGYLYKLRVLDVSDNNLIGPVPYSIAGLAHLEQLNLAHNLLTGAVAEGICALPSLENLTISYNFFCEEIGICQNLTSRGKAFDDSWNCLPGKRKQRSAEKCEAVVGHQVECSLDHCGRGGNVVATPPVMAPVGALFSNAPSTG